MTAIPDYYYEEDAKARPQISLPMELTETTNMLSYDAPDISAAQFQHSIHAVIPSNTPYDSGVSTPYSEQESSTRTSNDSNRNTWSPTSPGNGNAPPLTDSSSIESSPVLEKNHLSDYFPQTASPARSKTMRNSSSTTTDLAPAIPRRAASHSKREHERVARTRSLSRTRPERFTNRAEVDSDSSSSPTSDNNASPVLETEWRTSFDILGRSGSMLNRTRPERSVERRSGRSTPTRSLSASRAERKPAHPFSQELEQLNEVAEDVAGLDNALEAFQDEAIMARYGLVKCSADDYAADLFGLQNVFLADGESRVAHVDADGMQGWI